jgi:hypothetical protein
MDLWGAQTRGLPEGAGRQQFSNYDPLQALQGLKMLLGPQAMGGPEALKFLQLGQGMQQEGMGPANDPNMLLQLIHAILSGPQMQKGK